MKKSLLLVIVCLQCSIPAFTQSQNNEIIKCINSLEKGDTIQFGPASGHFNYYTYTKKDAGFGGGLNVELIKDDDLISKKYIIKNLFITYDYVKKEFYTETKQIISFGKKGGIFGVTYYADIYGAIKSGEIILQKKKQLTKENESVDIKNTNNELTDTIAFLYYVNGIGSSDKFVEEYLFRYMNDTYIQAKNDEFEYNKAVKKAKEQLLQNIKQQVVADKKFSIYVGFTLGNYDFENGGFPIQEDNPAYVVVPRGEYDFFKYFNFISLTFSNFTDFRFVRVPEDNANQLIKRRKDEYGNIDREVHALINFRITQSLDQSNAKSEPDIRTETERKIDYMNTGRTEKDYERQFIGEIISIEMYESKRFIPESLIGIIE